jgi:signal recognition particle subunit SRP54
MFESLSDKLQRVFKTLRGEGRLTEANIAEPLEEIRLALLEADVNQQVADELVASIRTRSLGQDVMDALAPGEQVVKILRDELLQVLGGEARLNLKTSQPPATILMAGLQGSGALAAAARASPAAGVGGHLPPRGAAAVGAAGAATAQPDFRGRQRNG